MATAQLSRPPRDTGPQNKRNPIGVFIEWLGEQKRTRLSPVSLFCGPPLGFLPIARPVAAGL